MFLCALRERDECRLHLTLADADLADRFATTFDQFSAYTTMLRRDMNFSLATPHVYWGMLFFYELQLRSRCEVAYAHQVYTDFELGRNAGERYEREEVSQRYNWSGNGSWTLFVQNEARQPWCSFHEAKSVAWLPKYRPPSTSQCGTSVDAGYAYACPAVPPHSIKWECTAQKTKN